jgi:hypothetical protein
MLGIIPITAMLGCGAVLTACAADTMTPGQEPADNRAGQADTSPQVFTLRVDSSTTAETITPVLLASAHDKLLAACAATPDKAVRVFNPLASGAYEDVPCSALLADSKETEETSGVLTSRESDGPIRQAQQKIGPISFLMCGLFLGASTLLLDKVMCPRAQTEEARKNCSNVGLGGGIALGILCSIPF